jgi:hypothetical protein
MPCVEVVGFGAQMLLMHAGAELDVQSASDWHDWVWTPIGPVGAGGLLGGAPLRQAPPTRTAPAITTWRINFTGSLPRLA